MTKLIKHSLLWPGLLAAALPVASTAQSLDGKSLFSSECAECHSIREGKQKKGPSLYGILHRKAASLSGFEYSEALKSTDWVWNEERLRLYLSQPAKKANPGGKMKYDGMSDPAALQAVIGYLQTLK